MKNLSQVYDAIQHVKARAPAFCTNFFPVESKLQSWLDHGELRAECRPGAAFFFRRDRHFEHLYYCAASLSALQQELTSLPGLRTQPLTADLLGNETTLSGPRGTLEAAGFHPYARLVRLSRSAQPGPPAPPGAPASLPASSQDPRFIAIDAGPSDDSSPGPQFADPADASALLRLLESCFEACAEQLPVAYEVDAAIAGRRILAIKSLDTLAALLFFETQGLTSILRFWTVAEPFRARGFGSALMRHYFALHPAVRRFILWVRADNQDAIDKYRHYGYVPDGLEDLVCLNAPLATTAQHRALPASPTSSQPNIPEMLL